MLFEPCQRVTVVRQLLSRTQASLLNFSIRHKLSQLTICKQKLADARTRLSPQIYSRLETAIETASSSTKIRKKTILKKKFEKLQERRTTSFTTTTLASTAKQPPALCADSSSSDPTAASPLHSKAIPSDVIERVSVIGNIAVPKPALDALSKGPKFVLTPSISHKNLQHIIQVETAALAYSLRWHITVNQHTSSTHTPTDQLRKICPFRNKRNEPPRTDNETEKTIKNLQADLQSLVEKHQASCRRITPNISTNAKNAILSLRNNEHITITKSDKGGEMVVMETSSLEQLCIEHLSDTTTYEKLKRNKTNAIHLKINKNLKEVLTRCQFPPGLIYNLQTPSSARSQRFYALPKTHKKELKIRPIISACGGVFDRLGWLLQTIFKPLLKQVSAHLNSTSDLIQRFTDTTKDRLKNKIPISFDVISLYTNINTNEAIDTALQYTNKYKLYTYGLETHDLYLLLHLLLDNNIFEYKNLGYFRQIRGLAMGNRISGTLAILAMDRFERLFIYRELEPKLSLYLRYVDDTGTVVNNTDEAHRILNYLNKKHSTIKFEMDLPNNDGYLPILDIQLKINPDGTIQYKPFTKKASKNITLHFQSHHPLSVKKAVANNELRRATRNSTTEHRTAALASATKKLTNNGYPLTWLKQHTAPPKKVQKRKTSKKQQQTDNPLVFNIPFITDKFNKDVQRILHKHNVPARLVNKRGTTLLQLSSKHDKPELPCKSKSCPAPAICQQSNIVYSATCLLCDKTYIGMTTRRLHDRAREHIYMIKNKDDGSALGEHYVTDHPHTKEPLITFKVLRKNRDLLRLHIEEAMAIKQANPALNRRQEDLGTGFLP